MATLLSALDAQPRRLKAYLLHAPLSPHKAVEVHLPVLQRCVELAVELLHHVRLLVALLVPILLTLFLILPQPLASVTARRFSLLFDMTVSGV